MDESLKNRALASMILGIISVVLAWVGLWVPFIGLAAAIVALVFAVKVRKALPEGEKSPFATAGLILGIIGVVINAVWIIIWIVGIVAFAAIASNSGEIQSIIQEGVDPDVWDSLIENFNQ